MATDGVTEGVHGSRGESLTLAPEPASGTGLHGEKLGAARTHDPNRPSTVAPAEIGVHSQDASGQLAPPADAETKHTGSTLTIGGAAGGAAPTVFDAATLKRLAAAAAAHSKTQVSPDPDPDPDPNPDPNPNPSPSPNP